MWLRCNVAVDLYAIAVDLQLYPDARSSSYSCEISGAVALIKFASGDLQRKKNTEKTYKKHRFYIKELATAA